MDRRTLYNLLRMNWQCDSSLPAEPWQVADYRSQSMETLFEILDHYQLALDKVSFQALANDIDTPEELTDNLLGELNLDVETYDRIYLVIFELWRRLVPEKMSLSIFCDELDHQIILYDENHTENREALQDIIANLAVVLDENTDHGENPREVFESISFCCANDLENFLYDFIAEQLDNGNDSYASELLEDFSPYIKETKWFDFLTIRLIAFTNISRANHMLHKLLLDHPEADLEFNLEILNFLVQGGDKVLFAAVVTQTLPLLTIEEEFQEVLSIIADYFHRLDDEKKESIIQEILKQRTHILPNQPLDLPSSQMSDLLSFLK